MFSEQEQIRRESLKKLRDLGYNPYPPEKFEVNKTSVEIKQSFSEGSSMQVVIAGRIMSRRIMGKASFMEIQDKEGKIQVYLNRDEICKGEDKTLYNIVFKKLLDIGDIVGIMGDVFITKVGEISVKAEELTILTKSLKPLPLPKKDSEGRIYDAFTDPEKRYRQRYVDLIVNPGVKDVFIKRTKLTNSMRQYLNEKGYLEVETPILQPLYGGASARPFKTHHNTLDIDLYLRIANELYLKRLIVGGFDGVYEFSKDFRNEGMSRFHNPEFTQMELYVAYKDYFWMMDLVEEMVEKIALDLHSKTELKVGDKLINFERPWRRVSMYEIIEEYTGEDISSLDIVELRAFSKQIGLDLEDGVGRGKIIDEIFGLKCEPNIIQPTFVTNYPVEMSPLAKKHRKHEGLVERFEMVCNGKEICNAFSELNDPIDQRKRFMEQLNLAKKGDKEAMLLDEDYINAIEYGMPPTAGLGIGIDRLSMLMTNSSSIQDVLFFPQMKPEQKNKK